MIGYIYNLKLERKSFDDHNKECESLTVCTCVTDLELISAVPNARSILHKELETLCDNLCLEAGDICLMQSKDRSENVNSLSSDIGMLSPERKKAEFSAHMFCPKEAHLVPEGKGEPMWKAMALPFHLKGKVCRKCGEPVAEHIIVVEKTKRKIADKRTNNINT